VAALCVAPLAAAAAPSAGVAGDACEGAELTPAGDNLEQVSASVSCLVNAARSDRGELPLRASGQLDAAAQGMSDLMVRQSFFAHVTPDGRTLPDRVAPTGYLPASDRWILGENLAWGSGALSTPRAIVEGWLNSSEHRATIFDPEYEDLGVGVTLGSPGGGTNGGATFTTDFGVQDSRPSVAVPARVTVDLGDAASRGISYAAACSRPCTLVARLLLSKRQVLATGRLRLPLGGTDTLTVRLGADALRPLRRLAGPSLALVTKAAGTPVARTTQVTLK
jgi:uncharacterized protein YkwD